MREPAAILLLLAAAGVPPTSAVEGPEETAVLQFVPSPPPSARERMRRWRDDSRDRLQPVLREWRAVAQVARQRPGGALLAGCRRLERVLESLDRRHLPVAPDPSVTLHLEETLRSLEQAVDSCTQGAWFLTAWRLARADASWRELRSRLLLYGLAAWPPAARPAPSSSPAPKNRLQ